jgi:hypothetical protein
MGWYRHDECAATLTEPRENGGNRYRTRLSQKSRLKKWRLKIFDPHPRSKGWGLPAPAWVPLK